MHANVNSYMLDPFQWHSVPVTPIDIKFFVCFANHVIRLLNVFDFRSVLPTSPSYLLGQNYIYHFHVFIGFIIHSSVGKHCAYISILFWETFGNAAWDLQYPDVDVSIQTATSDESLMKFICLAYWPILYRWLEWIVGCTKCLNHVRVHHDTEIWKPK